MAKRTILLQHEEDAARASFKAGAPMQKALTAILIDAIRTVRTWPEDKNVLTLVGAAPDLRDAIENMIAVAASSGIEGKLPEVRLQCLLIFLAGALAQRTGTVDILHLVPNAPAPVSPLTDNPAGDTPAPAQEQPT